MNIFFRTDASLEIGTGHVMRCMTLAEVLRNNGASIRFVCRRQTGDLIDLIRGSGFEVDVLPENHTDFLNHSSIKENGSVYADWLGCDWLTDAQQTFSILAKHQIDWLIVDHYALDVQWEKALRPVCLKLMVIDDLANRKHDCDLLLDQNLGRHETHYADLIQSNCTILSGPEYALLRAEFSILRDYSLCRRAESSIKELLITMGGVDKDNITGEVLDALKTCHLPEGCRITVVMGQHAPGICSVVNKAKQLPWDTKILVNVQNMGDLMAESDLAIGAAGTSAWERCCLGLPTITFVLADNQRQGAEALRICGAALILYSRNSLEEELQGKIELLQDKERLVAMQLACSSVTDGKGADRLATMIMKPHDKKLHNTPG